MVKNRCEMCLHYFEKICLIDGYISREACINFKRDGSYEK